MSYAKNSLWASGHDETVEVNQRALIDKVLARYSGEFTVFRELLQNSDDAQSKAVEIRFESKDFLERRRQEGGESSAPELEGNELPDLKTTPVHQWTFKNNGMLFRDEDWNRLKKIAEGNPDEEKIGAFGVGFYSLFSVTEEPFVTSGGQWMGFYWKDKKDQLFARRGEIPQTSPPSPPSTWTVFEMPLREPGPIPPAFDFTRFLASSITFMAYLSEVSVYLDDKCLSRLKKSSGVTKSLPIPPGLIGTSRSRMMNVTGIRSTPLHIKAEVMRWVYSVGTQKPAIRSPVRPTANFFTSIFGFGTPRRTPSPLPQSEKKLNLLDVNVVNVTLEILTADVNVNLDRKMKEALHRSTKKNPPSRLKYELIYTAKDEYDASTKEDEKQPFAMGSIFQGLRADLDGQGHSRIFIGHSTAQTTGLGGHMSSRFIPTVERESIDLVDRTVAVWNTELLYVGGFLARAAYELGLASVQALWEGGKATPGSAPPAELRQLLMGRAMHALKFFTFHPSTPSVGVSDQLETAFFACSKPDSFMIISTAGVRKAAEVRMPNQAFAGFIKDLPTIPTEVLDEGVGLIVSLQRRDMIKQITFADVLKELRSRPLTDEEMIACLTWWIGVHRGKDNPDIEIRTKLLEAAVLTTGTPGTPDERIVPLSSIRTFISSRVMGIIPIDGPLPDHVLPVTVSKSLQPNDVITAFPWTELTVVEWLRYLTDPSTPFSDSTHDLKVSAPWAASVLLALARAWPSMSKEVQGEVIEVLRNCPCVPTSQGLRIPEQAYFANVNLFPDLAIVTLPSGAIVKGALEKVLQALGVRKHVDLQVVFNRMIKTGDWTIADLIKYLVSVQSALSDSEIERLRQTEAFSAEVAPQTRRNAHRACDLYEPSGVHRQLGLPLINWGTQPKWRATSEEAKFLFRLGLRRFPPLEVVVNLAASADVAIRSTALRYLVDNIGTRYVDYDPGKFQNVAYVPALLNGETCMSTPQEVFASPEWAFLGLPIVEPAFRVDALTKLRVLEHPPSSVLVSLLEKRCPQNEAQARKWFTVLSGRISDFSAAELRRLSSMPIIPVKNVKSLHGNDGLRWLPPVRCYFERDSSRTRFHSKLFVFVDFGQQANSFLAACGVKSEPSVEEIALALLNDPHKFYELADGVHNFLLELRNIAVNQRAISQQTFFRMRKSPVLLCSQRKSRSLSKAEYYTSDGDDEDDWVLQYDLKRPDQIVIVDDTNGYQLFGDSIFTAPQEDLLESFYAELGSPRLSTLITEDYRTSHESKSGKLSKEIRALILERLPLFLHEQTHSKTSVPYKWLRDESHFVVKEFSKVLVTISLRFGEVRLSRHHEASAVAKRVGSSQIQLWLAATTVDMYEVATSLCRLILESAKASDALLFMTILSTDLRALKRRGYNVDRILRQQKAEQQAAEEAAKARVENNVLMSKPPTQSPQSGASILQEKGGDPQGQPGSSPSTPKWKQAWSNLREKNETPSPPQISRWPSNQGVTPLDHISKNIDQAIKACTPEKGHLLRNRERMSIVKESLNEGYCDISGRADLKLAGEMGAIKFFVSHDIPDGPSLMATKKDALARFIHLILPLAEIYKIPPKSLQVFHDVSGGLIAFNSSGSIFLNLRFYEEWHDADVRNGNLSPAYISWFFSLAHEIAHNLVQPHNSEHEFYFSAICEAHVTALGKLLLSA